MNKKFFILPKDQINLPIAFDILGNMLTLQQVEQTNKDDILHFNILDRQRRFELIIRRIEAQPIFEITMLGIVIGKERSIQELKNKTKIGYILIEFEEIVIKNLLECYLSS